MPEWFDGLDDTLKAHVTAQNWHVLPPDQAVAQAVKAHAAALQAAPQLPQNAVVVPTDTADAQGWEKVHRALGVPANPKEYKLEGVPEDQHEMVRSLAAKLHLTPSAAVQLAQELAGQRDSAKQADLSAKSAARNEQLAKLRQEWGGNFDHNSMIAERTRQTLGITPEVFEAMALAKGFDEVQKTLAQVGARLGEAPHNPGGGPGVVQESPQDAKTRMMADKAWVDKYLSGDRAAMDEMARVNQAIVAQRFMR